MTAQIAETLILDGRKFAMCSEPLEYFFRFGGARPDFAERSTALWRGYIGIWEIIDDRLYLIDLRGTLRNGGDASLQTVFPDYPVRVFAHWYSGTLRIPQGQMLEYVHAGYGSIYERDLMIEIEHGVLVSSFTKQNGAAKTRNGSDGYGIQAPPAQSFNPFEPFVVAQTDLLEQLTVQSIEQQEMVYDPLGAVPGKPFGHLNSAWINFIRDVGEDEQIWFFSATCSRCYGGKNLKKGYVIVNGNSIGRCFLTMDKQIINSDEN